MMMTQSAAVIETIKQLGGVATLGQIYQTIFTMEDCKWGTKTPQASIRRIVRHTPGIYVIRKGLYGLEDYRHQLESNGIIVQTIQNCSSNAIKQFNHTYYQGLLVEMGNMKEFGTFVPDQDKNKLFLQKPLGEIRTIKSMPVYTVPKLVKRSSTIDVIWFDQDQIPHSFFEVEHSTDIQNSLLKFSDLTGFSSRMIIVADSRRQNEFNYKISESAFRSIKDRVQFLTYKNLEKQYEQAIERKCFEVIL
jgi:hypothetical protein